RGTISTVRPWTSAFRTSMSISRYCLRSIVKWQTPPKGRFAPRGPVPTAGRGQGACFRSQKPVPPTLCSGGMPMSEVRILDHPLIQHKLALLRDKNTGPKDFRDLLDELSMLMAYEVTRHLPTEEISVETPVGTARCRVVSGLHLGLVPILRAGLGMVNGILRLVPTAKVGHIGLYRDHETLQPVDYYCKLP